MNTPARLSRLYASEHARWAAAWEAHAARVWGRLSTEALEAIAAGLDDLHDDDDLDDSDLDSDLRDDLDDDGLDGLPLDGLDRPAIRAWARANVHASGFDGPPDLTLWPCHLAEPPPLPPVALAAALALPVRGRTAYALALFHLRLASADAVRVARAAATSPSPLPR